MTLSEIIGEALLRVGGGTITPALSVRWGEAKTYLTMAVNYVMTGNYWLESRAEGEKTINPLLYTVFENIPIQRDVNMDRNYVTLPKNMITLPKARAIEIETMCGRKCLPLGQGDDALERFYGHLKTSLSYQVEGQKKVWLWNAKLATAIRAKYIVSVDELNDDDPILLPSDGEVKVIDLMVQFLVGERQEHKDYIQDEKDN